MEGRGNFNRRGDRSDNDSRREHGRGRNQRGRGRGHGQRQRGNFRGSRGRGRGRGGGNLKGYSCNDGGRARSRLSVEEQQMRQLTQVMNTHASKGDILSTERVFGDLLQRGLDPSVVTMNILLKAYVRGGATEKALQLLADMESGAPGACNVRVDEGSYNVVINALSGFGNIDRAWECLQRQHLNGFDTYKSTSSIIRKMSVDDVDKMLINPDVFCKFRINVDVLSSLIRVLCTAHPPRTKRAIKLLNDAESYGIMPDCRTYSIIIQRFTGDKNVELAIQYFNRAILVHDIKPDIIMITAILNAYVEANPPMITEAKGMVDSMDDMFGLEPDIMIYNMLIKGYTRMFPANCEDAHRTLDYCIEKGLTPSVVTFASVANAYCSVGMPDEAESLIRKAIDSNRLKPNCAIYNTLIKGYARCRCSILNGICTCICCTCSDTDRAMELVDEMEKRGLTPDEITLNTVIVAFCSSKQIDRAKAVIDKVMRSKQNSDSNIRPSACTYRVLLQGFLRVSSKSISESEKEYYIRLLKTIEMDMKEQNIVRDEAIMLAYMQIFHSLQCPEHFDRYADQGIRSANQAVINEALLLYVKYHTKRPSEGEGGQKLFPLDSDTGHFIKHGLNRLEQLKFKPTKATMHEVVSIYANSNDLKTAEDFLYRFFPSQTGSLEDAACKALEHNHNKSKDGMDTLDECCSHKSDYYSSDKQHVHAPSKAELEVIINGYIKKQQPDQADRVCEEFRKRYDVRLSDKSETKRKLFVALKLLGLSSLSEKYK